MMPAWFATAKQEKWIKHSYFYEPNHSFFQIKHAYIWLNSFHPAVVQAAGI